MGAQLMAVVAEGAEGRVYRSLPTMSRQRRCLRASPDGRPRRVFRSKALGFRVQAMA